MPEAAPTRPLPPGAVAILLALAPALLAGCVGETAAPTPTPSAAEAADEGRTVDGTVVDEEQRPIADATIVHLGGDAKSTSDASGQFRLTQLPAAAELLIQASHPEYRTATVRVDLQFQETTSARFVLPGGPSPDAYHLTNHTVGVVTCQVSFGSHHGFPGYYRESCDQAAPLGDENIKVPLAAGVQAAVLELSWEPQSQMADIMGLTVYLSTAKEEVLLGAVHSYPAEHYVHLFMGPTALSAAKENDAIFDVYVHVDPGIVDDHVPTNVGVVVQQEFELFVTAFYGDAPSPTWSVAKNG